MKNERKTKQYGGTCSSCGQVATTCVTGAIHTACPGYVTNYDFHDDVLNSLGATKPMHADGTIVKGHRTLGTWISSVELDMRRSENARRHLEVARTQVVATSKYNDGKFVGLDVTNGLGEPICFRAAA